MDFRWWKISKSSHVEVKVVILYVYIVGPSEPWVPHDFAAVHRRFVDTYKKHRPKVPHVLMPVMYRGERDETAERLFDGLDPKWAYYSERLHGFDIGVCQAVGSTLDADLIVCCNSQNHFHKDGWLERIVEAHKQYPDALLGPWASYENSPHIRGACMAMPPKLMRRYPFQVDSRDNAYRAESGDKNFTQWVRKQGIPALMVTWDQILPQEDWRKPPNIFRRGDQTGCLIWDRHTKQYFDADAAGKAMLAKAADGLKPKNPPIKTRYKTITVVSVANIAPMAHAEAINRTAAAIPYPCRKLLLSPKNADGFDGEWKQIPEWMPNGEWSLKRMCQFLMRGLHKYIETDIAILVHWDGFALNPDKWMDEFLNYDYIGAPWPKQFRFGAGRVGNGGFSVRSKRWLEVASKIAKPPNLLEASEDVYSCAKNPNHFLRFGCRIAPLGLAMRWSMEHRIEEFPKWSLDDSFGFHGLTDQAERKHLCLDRTK